MTSPNDNPFFGLLRQMVLDMQEAEKPDDEIRSAVQTKADKLCGPGTKTLLDKEGGKFSRLHLWLDREHVRFNVAIPQGVTALKPP
jgi:hypothetical protein